MKPPKEDTTDAEIVNDAFVLCLDHNLGHSKKSRREDPVGPARPGFGEDS